MHAHLPLSAAAAASALGVALGVRLLLLLSRSRALKPLSAATSAAAAALRAPRALAAASSPLAALLAASKAASKSYKAARALDPAARLPSLPSSKRVKAAFAAASLLRLAAASATPLLLPAAASSSPTAFAALALLKSGYKLSKNSAKVVEGFLGLQVHKGFRNGVDALGVVVKVAVIASELAVWVGGRCWGRDGGHERCVRFVGFTRPGGLVLAGCSKAEAQVLLFDPGAVEMDDEGCWLEDSEFSELLCLAVPVPEMAKLVS
ncbi:uncharacterized protein LOC100822615 [Brachypodium distachyon]|uniref:Uncharacterized protein n=1 Tax=Brachypodium distachyon TaxID=15368 RepID=I1H9X9_BRADI|nr:uncharacterized protein LOC100822615 [Brachypodium distachyon]PNT78239.1 hypothetical protein BRADI_1g75770v3 [Brachypodium distachyon]|eukprot:XP_014751798.1 uncharacterized protein LOC100822615 [Brachypodium distachyon]